MNCGNEIKMTKWSSQWTQIMQLRKEAFPQFIIIWFISYIINTQFFSGFFTLVPNPAGNSMHRALRLALFLAFASQRSLQTTKLTSTKSSLKKWICASLHLDEFVKRKRILKNFSSYSRTYPALQLDVSLETQMENSICSTHIRDLDCPSHRLSCSVTWNLLKLCCTHRVVVLLIKPKVCPLISE